MSLLLAAAGSHRAALPDYRTGLVFDLDMSKLSGSTVPDQSGNGNDLVFPVAPSARDGGVDFNGTSTYGVISESATTQIADRSIFITMRPDTYGTDLSGER